MTLHDGHEQMDEDLEESEFDDAESEDFVPLQHAIEAVSRRRRLTQTPRLVARAIRLTWNAGPAWLIISALVTTVSSLLAVAQVFAVRYALGKFVAAQSDTHLIWRAWPWLLALTIITGLSMAMVSVTGLVQRQMSLLVLRQVMRQVLRVTTRVPLNAYETPTFFNQLQRVQAHSASRPLMLVNYLINLVAGTLGVAGMIGTLIALAPPVLPILVLAAVPLVVAGRLSGRVEFSFAVEQASPQRERTYLEAVLTSREGAKEVRSFGLAKPLLRRWEDNYGQFLRGQAQMIRTRAFIDLWGVLLASGIGLVAVLELVHLIASGSVSVADAGTAALAIRVLSGRAQSMSGGVGGLFESRLFLEDLEAFLAVPVVDEPDETTGTVMVPDEIVAEDVDFTYPASHRPSLIGAGLRIRRGEVVALVGANGSGKTTLAKILAGLHQPTRGRVLWDGIDIGDLPPDAVRDHVAVVFQDYMRYALSALDNVTFGRPDAPIDFDSAHVAAEKAGIDEVLDGLRDGWDTTLSKVFTGGTELSIGQWQRVALARAFYRDAPLLILDEPTSALDPRGEQELFTRVGELMAGRSVILISHRFATVRSADRIYVLDKGRVIEEGSHEDLMQLNGRYAEMYSTQVRSLLGDAAKA